MRRISTALVVIGLLSAGPLWPASSAWAQQPEASGDAEAQASDKERFRQLAAAGSKAFAAKDYETAEKAFRQAYAIKPVPNLLYNIGRALEKQGDFEAATDFYEKFVNEPDVELKARRDALQRLKTLREVLALREEGEEVDQEEVEQKQGDHELAEAGEGEQTQPDAVEEPPVVVEDDYTLAYTFTGLGAATLVGSGVFAILAAGEKSNADDAATLAERRDAADTGQTYTTVADSMLAAGAVLTGVGIYFFASPPQESVSQESVSQPSVSQQARIAPSVGPDGASVTFTLDF
ncbi:hypothetical protein FIV42_19075 [Persicimonas caeni]|uniref:Tetratricopeptide repeat protein n=1 Tax=Persicimonas caeni TaxID=2292766 RepID=A0A4Y6PWR6_PERCE|nr:tetratricopeptide repeat protein [Persicimonas caeni]QDG52768.1 hypothetical protein FIV42_19075 [Persicimonas caeni]QED33990.1 hypothetical protein FRD00_19070 [Persicimonas caeni]